jgi:hypothetical protein
MKKPEPDDEEDQVCCDQLGMATTNAKHIVAIFLGGLGGV